MSILASVSLCTQYESTHDLCGTPAARPGQFIRVLARARSRAQAWPSFSAAAAGHGPGGGVNIATV